MVGVISKNRKKERIHKLEEKIFQYYRKPRNGNVKDIRLRDKVAIDHEVC